MFYVGDELLRRHPWQGRAAMLPANPPMAIPRRVFTVHPIL